MEHVVAEMIVLKAQIMEEVRAVRAYCYDRMDGHGSLIIDLEEQVESNRLEISQLASQLSIVKEQRDAARRCYEEDVGPVDW